MRVTRTEKSLLGHDSLTWDESSVATFRFSRTMWLERRSNRETARANKRHSNISIWLYARRAFEHFNRRLSTPMGQNGPWENVAIHETGTINRASEC